MDETMREVEEDRNGSLSLNYTLDGFIIRKLRHRSIVVNQSR